MSFMGIRNDEIVSNLERLGYFNTAGKKGPNSNNKAVRLAHYLAKNTLDVEDIKNQNKHNCPPRCYFGGHEEILYAFGLLTPDEHINTLINDGVITLDEWVTQRMGTLIPQISRTFNFLEKRKIIKKIVDARSERNNAIYVLLLGDEAENKMVERQAVRTLGLQYKHFLIKTED